MKKKKLVVSLIVVAILLLLIVPVVLISPVLFQMGSVLYLERQMCSREYYEPVARDLALICSNIKSENESTLIYDIWWPDSVRSLEPVHGSLSKVHAAVLYTCGFTHLSYRLQKVQDDDINPTKWELYFDDEGRRKYLTTIELTGNEKFSFDKMFETAINVFALKEKECSDRIEQLEYDKNNFFSLFDKTMGDQFNEQ